MRGDLHALLSTLFKVNKTLITNKTKKAFAHLPEAQEVHDAVAEVAEGGVQVTYLHGGTAI